MQPHVVAPQHAPLADVPAPPPGPGVVPPFAAPPRDRDNKGLWIGLGVGGLVLALCCVGGFLGFGMVVQGSESIVRAQASTVTRDYLEALRLADYPRAYELLCSDLTERFTPQAFETRAGRAKVEEFTIDGVQITEKVEVAATVRRAGGQPTQERFPLVQEPTFKVCGGV